MLNLRRLHVLAAVVDAGSVTAAAERLGFTPSSVSQQVNQLERELGMPLLEKSGRGIRPTIAGQALADHAQPLLDSAAAVEDAMSDLREGRVGRVRFASFASAGDSLLPVALAQLRARLPGVHVATSIVEGEQVWEAMRAGRIDVAITLEPYTVTDQPNDGYVRQHLFDDPYRLILPADHPYASQSTIELLDVAGEEWVACVGATGACQDATITVCHQYGFEPRFVAEAAEFPAAQAYVAAGLGISLVPVLALGAVRPGVVVRRLRREPEPRHVWLVVRPAVADLLPIRETVRAIKAAATAHRRALRAETVRSVSA